MNLDGRQDWVIAQRQALLAWTGHTLNLAPQYNIKLGLAHWGNTYITGRGLLALAGSGQIYQVQVKAGESYVAHPRYIARESLPICKLIVHSNIVAYATSSTPPFPFRFKSSNLRFQVPDLGLGPLIQSIGLIKTMSKTTAWRACANAFYTVKTWMRRTIWGDRVCVYPG